MWVKQLYTLGVDGVECLVSRVGTDHLAVDLRPDDRGDLKGQEIRSHDLSVLGDPLGPQGFCLNAIGFR
jgi:hypothetical protein